MRNKEWMIFTIIAVMTVAIIASVLFWDEAFNREETLPLQQSCVNCIIETPTFPCQEAGNYECSGNRLYYYEYDCSRVKMMDCNTLGGVCNAAKVDCEG